MTVPTTAPLPGVEVELRRPPPEPAPLRTDIAGIVGRTPRGPLGEAVRVIGLRELAARFGGLDPRWHTPYAARGYFGNGGQVAHVVRLPGADGAPAAGLWMVGELVDDAWSPDVPADAPFPVTAYRIEAKTPGRWADGTAVTFTHRRSGPDRAHIVHVRVEVPGEEPETLTADPADVPAGLASSRFVRAVPAGAPAPGRPTDGPAGRSWPAVLLGGGADPRPGPTDYLAAVARLADVDEVALVVLPDLHADLDPSDAADVTEAVLSDAARLGDRLVVLDAPAPDLPAEDVAGWLTGLGARLAPPLRRAGAVYHPWLRVPDPLGGPDRPLRDVPPSGPVAGLVSRLDRRRGPGHTPANALLLDAVDLTVPVTEAQQRGLRAGGVNPIRCRPGRGLEVWGGATLDLDEPGRFLAHRRLLHRLVRAIRRVAEPLVFEANTPELRFALVRGLTSVLLEAYRSGALKGERPEEGFAVRCDDTTNPPNAPDTGLVVCEIDVAPAQPMEFLRLRLTFAAEGELEVAEA